VRRRLRLLPPIVGAGDGAGASVVFPVILSLARFPNSFACLAKLLKKFNIFSL
jgi:hypothetical protein